MRKPVYKDFGLTSQKYTQLREERWRLNQLILKYNGPSNFGWALVIIFIILSLFFFKGKIDNTSFGLIFCFLVTLFGIDIFKQQGKLKSCRNQLSGCKFNKINLYDEAIKKYELCQENYWKSLRGVEFEKALANLYRNLGYSVQVTKGSGDEGIDLILDEKIIVQCKGHEKSIGVGAIRDLYGSLKHHTEYESAVLACPAGFTDGVKNFAYGKPIKLIALKDIIEMAESVSDDKNKE